VNRNRHSAAKWREISGRQLFPALTLRELSSADRADLLDPEFLLQVKNVRSRGTVAKVNFALTTLPIQCAEDQSSSAHLGGVVQIGPTLEYLERAADDAKYGRFLIQPLLRSRSSVADPFWSFGKHVMSV
jgi:hypothetical protein